jgi:hypothetical protein
VDHPVQVEQAGRLEAVEQAVLVEAQEPVDLLAQAERLEVAVLVELADLLEAVDQVVQAELDFLPLIALPSAELFYQMDL